MYSGVAMSEEQKKSLGAIRGVGEELKNLV